MTFGASTVKSMHLDLLDDDTKYLKKKYICKMKVPLKIIFYVVPASESNINT
jgi:hypothetical protein